MPKTAHHYIKYGLLLVAGFCVIFYLVAVVTSLRNISIREKFTPEQLAAKEGKFADIDGAKVYYEYYRTTTPPAKSTVLLLHGFGANMRTWDQQLPYLRANYDVLLVDMLGFGLTQEIGGSTLGQEAQATMIVKLMGYLAISKAFVIGNSMGGGIAQRLALNVPQKVSGLVLIDSVDLTEQLGYGSISVTNNPLMAQVPIGLALNMDTIATLLDTAYGDPERVQPDTAEKYFRPFTIKGSTRNLVAHSFAPSHDRLVETGLITQPVLILQGTKDTWIPSAMTDHLKTGLPNHEFVEIAGAGHAAHEEDPVVVNQVIGSWLDRMLTK